MDLAEKDLLLKIAGQLGSDSDNIRLIALNKISAVAARNKMTLEEIFREIYAGAARKPKYDTKGRYNTARQPGANPFGGFTGEWSSVVVNELFRLSKEFGIPLNDWERSFCAEVSSRYMHDGDLTEKQRACADKIIRKARRSGWKG